MTTRLTTTRFCPVHGSSVVPVIGSGSRGCKRGDYCPYSLQDMPPLAGTNLNVFGYDCICRECNGCGCDCH